MMCRKRKLLTVWIQTFRTFIEENRDEIIDFAYHLQRILCKPKAMAVEQLESIIRKTQVKGITVERLWDCYAIKKPDKVKKV